MRNLVLSIAASAAVLAVGPLANAQAPSNARLVFGVDAVGAPPILQDVQFLFGGRNYCWYPGGWHGAGYYWCGYAYRRGLGWGGPVGWHGWRGGGHGGFGDHGGAGPHEAMAHGGPGGGHGGQPGGDHGGGHAEGGHAEGGHGGGGHGDGGHH